MRLSHGTRSLGKRLRSFVFLTFGSFQSESAQYWRGSSLILVSVTRMSLGFVARIFLRFGTFFVILPKLAVNPP